jgi:hypothetical protein
LQQSFDVSGNTGQRTGDLLVIEWEDTGSGGVQFVSIPVPRTGD